MTLKVFHDFSKSTNFSILSHKGHGFRRISTFKNLNFWILFFSFFEEFWVIELTNFFQLSKLSLLFIFEQDKTSGLSLFFLKSGKIFQRWVLFKFSKNFYPQLYGVFFILGQNRGTYLGKTLSDYTVILFSVVERIALVKEFIAKLVSCVKLG